MLAAHKVILSRFAGAYTRIFLVVRKGVVSFESVLGGPCYGLSTQLDAPKEFINAKLVIQLNIALVENGVRYFTVCVLHLPTRAKVCRCTIVEKAYRWCVQMAR